MSPNPERPSPVPTGVNRTGAGTHQIARRLGGPSPGADPRSYHVGRGDGAPLSGVDQNVSQVTQLYALVVNAW